MHKLKHPATGFLAKRDALLMCLLLDRGLRVGEIATLKRNDIHLRGRLLTFYRPKVDEPQNDRMTDDTLAAARAYLPTLPAKQVSLFDLAIISIQERVRTLGELVGIKGLPIMAPFLRDSSRLVDGATYNAAALPQSQCDCQ